MERPIDHKWLRLTPFEEYMLFDDRAGWPMTFWIRLLFSKPLETDRLSRAMLATSAQHPLLSTRVFYDSHQRPYWGPSEPLAGVRVFDSAESTVRPPPAVRFNLACEPAWRIWKSSSRSDSSIWLEFHHAVC